MKVSFLVFVYVNRVWHSTSMRLRFKQNNVNVNFCEIMEIVSENSGEIRGESSMSAARSDSQCVASSCIRSTRSFDRPIDRLRVTAGTLSKMIVAKVMSTWRNVRMYCVGASGEKNR